MLPSKHHAVLVLAVVIGFFAGAMLHRPAKVVAQDGQISLPPQVERFRIVELHSSTASEWSGLLDTQTGCVWQYATNTKGEKVWDFVEGARSNVLTKGANLMTPEQQCLSAAYWSLPEAELTGLAPFGK